MVLDILHRAISRWRQTKTTSDILRRAISRWRQTKTTGGRTMSNNQQWWWYGFMLLSCLLKQAY